MTYNILPAPEGARRCGRRLTAASLALYWHGLFVSFSLGTESRGR